MVIAAHETMKNVELSNYKHFITFHESVGQERGHDLAEMRHPRSYLHTFSALAVVFLFTVFVSCSLSSRAIGFLAQHLRNLQNATGKGQALLRVRIGKGTGTILDSSYRKDAEKQVLRSDIYLMQLVTLLG